MSTTTSKGPCRSRRSGLSSGTQAWSGLEPLHHRWSAAVTLPLWFQRIILTTTRIAIDIPPKIATVCFLGTISIPGAPSSATILGFLPTTPGSHFFFLVVCIFRIWFVFLWNFYIFFSSTYAYVWLLRTCGKEMGIWILVGVLKNLLNYGNVQYLLILIWTLCFQTLIEKFNFDSFFFLVFRYILYFFLILFIILKKKITNIF